MNSKSGTVIYIVFIAVLVFYVLGLLMRGYWNWSVFSLPDLRWLQLTVLGLILVSVSIPGVTSTLYSKLMTFFAKAAKTLDHIPGTLKAILWISIPFVLLFLIKIEVHIYGDAQNLIGSIVSGEILSPFYNRIGMLLQIAAGPLGLVEGSRSAAADYVSIVSILSGIVYLFFSWKSVAILIESRGEAVLSFFAVATSGLIIIFAGHVEIYSVIIAWLSIYVYYTLRFLEGQGRVWKLILLFLIGLILHFWFIAFLPSLLFVFHRKIKFLNLRVAKLLAILFCAGIYVTGQIIKRGEFSLTIPPLATEKTNYWLFAPEHVLDILNQFIMVGPALAILALAILIFIKPANLTDSKRFLIWVGLPAMAISFVIDPHLGAVRDWDLLSIFAAPLIILGAVLLHEQKLYKFRYILAAILLFNILNSGSFIWINKKPDYAIDRVVNILLDDPHYNEDYHGGSRIRSFGNILIGIYKRPEDVVKLYSNVEDLSKLETIDLTSAAVSFHNIENYEKAQYIFSLIPDISELAGENRYAYGHALVMTGRYERAADILKPILQDTVFSDLCFLLGVSYAHQNQIDSSLKYLDITFYRSSNKVEVVDPYVYLFKSLGHYDVAARYQKYLVSFFPDSAEVRMELANLYELAGMPDSAKAYRKNEGP
ncbi:MAG: hypothetical protein GWO41_09095 [candidate division Zixibacteria bacterium]|nr:hypothetical protein [candidate division Zixibacteria bacterium]NIR65862.1 hypothetical protein [candidate division Zixibacteria bacterium]NIS16500.1 hypothetical protein [candidate division Zixibacteria bacterium]NIS47516.1 hypothetical protein [candidate division Zixibacteria bacterium]NIT52873.1 hypothetical protein [candidate division Zixibacteria bacterium]